MKIWLIMLVAVLVLAGITSPQIPYNGSKELISPYDRVKDSQINVYDDAIVIYINNAELAGYADTNSMDPLLDRNATGLEIIPESENDIYVGDVVAYEPNWADGLIVHRVIDKGMDKEGAYYVLKGDNNTKADPEMVRFSQIRYVLIGVIY